METTRPAYRALRGKSVGAVPPLRKDAIAARFEDCLQLFERLRAYIAQSPNSGLPDMVATAHEDFLAWGRDSGAAAQCIDRTLRKSTQLAQRILELLEKIHSKIEQAADKIEGLSIINEEMQQRDSVLSRDASPLEQDEEALTTLVIKHVNNLVPCLAALLPNLQNPFPIDLYSPGGTFADSYPDIDLARGLFPSTTPALLNRLGSANWRRRKHLKYLRYQRRPEIRHRISRAPLREVDVDAFNFQKPALREVDIDVFNFQKPILTAHLPKAPNFSGSPNLSESTHFTEGPPILPRFSSSASLLAGSEAGQSTLGGSIYSKFGLRLDGSVIAASNSSSLVDVSYSKERTVPQPPIPLGSGQAFMCPYCNDVIGEGPNVITDFLGWKNHVMSDLEPYLCTFDDCLQAAMTFADSERWFRHEVEHHRGEFVLKKTVWTCQYCREDFELAAAFERHLRQKHGNVCGPLQIEAMVSLCAESFDLSREDFCPLCCLGIPAETLKDHIANHLEQFALFSIDDDDSSESSGVEDAEVDSIRSNIETRLQRLNDFLEEQRGLVFPDMRGLMDKGGDDSNLDFARDSDDGGRAALVTKEESLQKTGIFLDGGISEIVASASEHGNNSTLRTVPYPRYNDFVGRDDYLANMYKILSVPGRICTLNGTGGMGKTAIAVEYTYRYEQIYSYVFWIQADTRFGCSDTFSLITVALGLGSDGDDQTQLVETGRDFLQRTERRWLLVFDHVDDWENIGEYIPVDLAKTQGSVLITSRIDDFRPKSKPECFFSMPLTEMRMDEGRLLLMRCLKSDLNYYEALNHPEWRVAADIASLAGLPLAIYHIAGYIDASCCSLAEFLELWNEWPKPGLSEKGEFYKNITLETTWNIGLMELGSEALKLLKIMAFLDGDSIQREILINDHRAPALGFLHSSKVFRCRRIITELNKRKLISINDQKERVTFSVHRLLQQRLLQDLEKKGKDKEEIFDLAFQLIRERLPRPPIDNSDSFKWNIFKESLPHVLAILRIFDNQLPVIKPFFRLAKLFMDAGMHLSQRGIIDEGLRLLSSAEAMLDRLGAEEYQLRVDIHIATGLLIQSFGISHRAKTRDLFEKILITGEKLAGAASPGTLTKEDYMKLCNVRVNYGNALLEFNDYYTAELIYQQCDAKYQEWGAEGGMDFPSGELYHHLAFCRIYHKEFQDALKLSEKAVELVSRQTKNLQLTLKYKFDLACIMLQCGDLEESLERQQQILKARLNMQGTEKNNYSTLQSYYAVGALYAFLGKLYEAEHHMRRAIPGAQGRPKRGSLQEAAVARTEFHLAQVLKKSGKDPGEAEELFQKARSVLSRLLPWDPIEGIQDGDELALYDHLQPVFGGRFTGTCYLKYVT